MSAGALLSCACAPGPSSQLILDSKGATLGAYGGLVAAGSTWLPFTGNVDATNYAEISKYLINAGLAQTKGTYGANMTQGDVGLQLNEASPGKNMPEQAIRNLVNTNTELYSRGALISKPIEALGDYFDAKIKNAYAAADAAAKGRPIDMDATNSFLRDNKANFLGTVEGNSCAKVCRLACGTWA